MGWPGEPGLLRPTDAMQSSKRSCRWLPQAPARHGRSPTRPSRRRRFTPPLAVLAVPTLLLCSALASCAAQPSACPGYFDQGQGAARLSYEAIIPPDHLLDIFTPQRFTELLGELVDGLQLEVLRVES